MLNRRQFLQGAGAAATAFLIPGLPRPARAMTGDPVLVALYLRGAADSLNLVVPAGDPDYYASRPDIQVPAGDEIPLGDGFFGLNPLLGDLAPLFESGELAFVHAAGNPLGTRSHFEAQDRMELALAEDPQTDGGWLNRYLQAAGLSNSWAGISLSAGKALSLQGPSASLAMASVNDFLIDADPSFRAMLESIYPDSIPSDLDTAASEAFSALDVIGAVPLGTGVVYPQSPLGRALRDAAALIKADVGVRVVTVDVGGWDHHEGEVAAMGNVAPGLAAAIAAFRADLAGELSRVCLLGMTEFGRNVVQNGSQGTDHGYGSLMLCLGGGISGGRVLLADDVWPGLAEPDLFDGQDLQITTDFRDVFGEILNRHMGVSVADLEPILPGHPASANAFPGLYT
jgi:uncharacterized protein (DUF1501 family)